MFASRVNLLCTQCVARDGTHAPGARAPGRGAVIDGRGAGTEPAGTCACTCARPLAPHCVTPSPTRSPRRCPDNKMAALSPPPPPAAAPAPTAGLRAGAQLTVTVEHVVSGTVVVSTNFGGSSFTGILIDMAKK